MLTMTINYLITHVKNISKSQPVLSLTRSSADNVVSLRLITLTPTLHVNARSCAATLSQTHQFNAVGSDVSTFRPATEMYFHLLAGDRQWLLTMKQHWLQ